MIRTDLPDIARRLDAILRDIGYAGDSGEGKVDHERAWRVISRRVYRPLCPRRWANLVKGRGAEWTAAEVVTVADGLGFDVRRILYDNPPRHADRPTNLLDELDQIGLPY